jgi:hypothetical protein
MHEGMDLQLKQELHFATGDGIVSWQYELLVMEIMWLLGMVMDTKHCTAHLSKYNCKAGQRVAEET